jgi:hypothetical protein
MHYTYKQLLPKRRFEDEKNGADGVSEEFKIY